MMLQYLQDALQDEYGIAAQLAAAPSSAGNEPMVKMLLHLHLHLHLHFARASSSPYPALTCPDLP